MCSRTWVVEENTYRSRIYANNPTARAGTNEHWIIPSLVEGGVALKQAL